MIRVAWVPSRNTLDTGSFRLQCWYNHCWLNAHGLQSTILDLERDFAVASDGRFTTDLRGRFDVLVWKKPERADEAAAGKIPYVLFFSDGPMPSPNAIAGAAALVTDSPWVIANRFRGLPMVGDMAPQVRVVPVTAAGDIPADRLHYVGSAPSTPSSCRLVWVGTEQNYLWAKPTLDALKAQWPLDIISRGDFVTTEWRLDTVAKYIQSAHVGVVPMPAGLRFGDTCGFNPMAKDIDRVTFLQACGIPVVASPLPSYVEYIRQGVDGLIADGPDQFGAAVALLAGVPECYRAIAAAGKARAMMTASTPFTGSLWKDILEDVVYGRDRLHQPVEAGIAGTERL